MMTLSKEMAIQKITEMPTERVSKVLIFMAGMEAEHIIDGKSVVEKQCDLSSHENASSFLLKTKNSNVKGRP